MNEEEELETLRLLFSRFGGREACGECPHYQEWTERFLLDDAAEPEVLFNCTVLSGHPYSDLTKECALWPAAQPEEEE